MALISATLWALPLAITSSGRSPGMGIETAEPTNGRHQVRAIVPKSRDG
jgi:hypothetical protein